MSARINAVKIRDALRAGVPAKQEWLGQIEAAAEPCTGNKSMSMNYTHFDAFWLVWNEKSKNLSRRYENQAEAEEEALRLAAENPTTQYAVLRAVRMTPPPPAKWLLPDERPF